MNIIKNIRKIINNVSDAAYGVYVGKDSQGISYREKYEKYAPPIGKQGMREDRKNLAKDLRKAIHHYEQKKTQHQSKN